MPVLGFRKRAALAVALAMVAGALGRVAVDGVDAASAPAAPPIDYELAYYIPDSVREHLIYRVVTDRRAIAFTFDDGPDPRYTPRVLEVLARHRAQATFFVTGSRVERYPDIVRNVQNQGHEVASHGFTHTMLTQLGRPEIRREIERADEAIRSVTGGYPRLFRPPFGRINHAVLVEALAHGRQVVMWSWNQDSGDWRNPGANAIARKVLRGLQDGDIILLHDFGGRRDQTVSALEEILSRLDALGYRYLSVSELLREGRIWKPPPRERPRPPPPATPK